MAKADHIVNVGIFAASSIVPEIEFRAGVEHLKRSGFAPRVQPQVSDQWFMFPGSDEDRAQSIYELASDDSVDVLWAARGGYGAGRLLPLLERITAARGVPAKKKLLVGYSDVTVLHEFVRTRWGWSTLHAPMPAASNFAKLDEKEWRAIVDYVRGVAADAPWQHAQLAWMEGARPRPFPIRAELIGGNLSLWAALAGTPWQPSAAGKIVFLEDVDEAYYRIDRMMVQLEQAGMLNGAAAIVLGDFTDCHDENNTCRASETGDERKPLRKVFEQSEAWPHLFDRVARATGVPIATGLPVGHGPHYAPLPLGARYELSPDGKLKLLEWDWLRSAVT